MGLEKLTIELPHFESWDDVFEWLYYERSDIGEQDSKVTKALEEEFPHGLKVGNKYVQI